MYQVHVVINTCDKENILYLNKLYLKYQFSVLNSKYFTYWLLNKGLPFVLQTVNTI